MYKGCIFDLDGTLANTIDSIAYFGNTALAKNGYNTIPIEEYKLMVGNGAELLIKRMLSHSAGSFSEAEYLEVRLDYDKLYEGDPLYLVKAYEGIPQLLLTLQDKGIKVCVLSNKPDDMTNQVVKNLFGKELFCLIRGQRDGVPTKPDPTAPSAMLREMGLTPMECLYIGDSGVDMETGKNAGMDTVGVTWGFRTEKELTDHGALTIAHCAEELKKIILA